MPSFANSLPPAPTLPPIGPTAVPTTTPAPTKVGQTNRPSSHPSSSSPTLNPTGSRSIITWAQWQNVQQYGLDANTFQNSTSAIYAFKSAIASTMPGVGAENVVINLVKTLTTTVSTAKHVRRSLQDVNETIVASGIGINYNITVNIVAFNFVVGASCYEFLSSQLITAIVDGNFTQYLKDEAANNNVNDLFKNASSTATDLTIKSYAFVASKTTSYPSSSPTGAPSNMSSPTPEYLLPPQDFDLVGSMVIAAIVFATIYLTSVVIGCFRNSPDNKGRLPAIKSKLVDSKIQNVPKKIDLESHIINLDTIKMSDTDFSI